MANIRSNLKAIALALAGFIFAAPLTAQDLRPSVAVLEPVGVPPVTQMNKLTARGALEQFLVKSRRYKVVDRNRIDQTMKEHKFGRSELTDPDSIKRLGKMINADMICSSELLKEDGNFIALCSIIDVESGEVSASAYELIESDTAAEIRNAMDRAAQTMLDIIVPGTQAHSGAASGTGGSGASTPASTLTDPRLTRIAVIIPEIHISAPIPDPAGETAIIRKLLDAGFKRVVDKAQVEKIRNTNMVKALIGGDLSAATTIGLQLGVDVIIVGEAFSEAVGRVQGNMFSCRARVEARAVRTDNATIIAAHGFHAGGVDLVEFNSAKVALNNAGEMMGDYMAQKILERGATTEGGITLTVRGVHSFSRLTDLMKAIKAVKGVQEARQSEYTPPTAVIDLTTSLPAQVLADQFGNIKAPRIEVTGTTQSTIDITLR
jgi:hypothetical protein